MSGEVVSDGGLCLMPDGVRSIVDTSGCCGCHACSSACPEGCIAMVSDAEGFLYPVVDQLRCRQCGVCEKVCPIRIARIGPKHPEGAEQLPDAYAVQAVDEGLRRVSSSGGMFSLLAERVLRGAGVVFGAAFDGDLQVVHRRASGEGELAQLRGSKYVQSEIGDCYVDVQAALDAGTEVLFTGTPCQVAGLKAYLRHDYENLLTADVICHGVPSPKAWRQYLAYQEAMAECSALSADFRYKDQGWKRFSMRLRFSDGTEYVEPLTDDYYMRAFLADIDLRPSCYVCAFKTVFRLSDITLADFWGLEDITPEMDDDLGTSLVLVHSERGRRQLRSAIRSARALPVDLAMAVRDNPALTESASRNALRKRFMKELDLRPMDRLVEKYLGMGFRSRARRLLARITQRLMVRIPGPAPGVRE